MCGFSEFTDPSDPPKKYAKITNAGSIRQRFFQPSTVCDPATTIIDVTTNYDLICTVSHSNCDGGDNGGTGTCGKTTFSPPFTTQINSKTESKSTGGGCLVASGISSVSFDGDWVNTLSDEDKEEDAIARAMAAIGGWSDCLLGASAFITDRSGTGGFAFAFRSVQVNVQFNPIIGRSYSVRVNFYRRTLGSGGPFLDLGQPFEGTVTPGTSPEITDWIDIPNQRGFETIASGCIVKLLPI